MPEYKLKDKKSFKEEVVSMVVKIFELSCNEFRGGYWTKKDHGNWVEEIYTPDGRRIYCQAVECLCFILLPHFYLDEDEINKMNKDRCKKLKKIKENYNEIDKKLKENLKKLNDGNGTEKRREDFAADKLTLTKDMFKQLMRLLKILKINVVTSETRVG